jgi:membrane fusion protein (multidrug efflux system)
MTDTTTMEPTGEPRRRRRGMTVVAWIVAAIVLVIAARTDAFGLLGENQEAGGPGAGGGGMPPMPVDVDTARRDTVVDAVRATGRIEAVQAVELRPDEQGRITEILFREGQSVTQGTPLIKIDDEMLKAQAERAVADRDLANQQLERVRRLRAQNASSPADQERAEAAARSATAALELLRLQIERTTVRAPFSGVVGQRFVSVGDYVTTQTPLASLQTMDPQRVVIEVPERYSADLRRGQTVQFTVAAYPGRTFTAEVEFIDPVVQDAARTIVLKARAPNRDHALKPGMFVEARLAIGQRTDAVVVPEDAVQPLRTANVVWAVVDGKADRRVVELGTRAPGRVEIVNGVEPGDIVVVGGLERMGEGMPVAPRQGGPPAGAGDSLAADSSAVAADSATVRQ